MRVQKLSGAVLPIVVLTAACCVIPSAAHAANGAQVSSSQPGLALSMEAMNEALRFCQAKGYRVSVTIVNPDGIIKVQARDDGSPIHSQRFSFRKAYTIMSMGPMFGVDTSSSLVKFLANYPANASNVASGATDLLFLPGAALIKANKTVIGAIGVSGAPLSSEDEACAQAGAGKGQLFAEGR